MTINKTCYINSVKKDILKLKMWIELTCGTLIGTYIGVIFPNEIIGFITYMLRGIPFITPIPLFLLLFVAIHCYIITMTPTDAKNKDCNELIVTASMFVGIFLMGVLLLYSIYASIYGVSQPDRGIYLTNTIGGVIVLLIVNTYITPFTLAYTRCNNEPDNGEP